jgi:hypothetical protein
MPAVAVETPAAPQVEAPLVAEQAEAPAAAEGHAGGFRAPELPTPSFEPMVWPPVGQAAAPAPVEAPKAELAVEAPVATPAIEQPAEAARVEQEAETKRGQEPVVSAELEVPQQRWAEEPVPEGHLDATTPAASAEAAESAGAPAAVLKGGALGARLSQLRRHRPG